MAEAPFQVGEEVGPYRLIAQLGQGGMATVFRAHHAALDRDVALKAMHPAFLQDPGFVSRFRKEARVVALLEHPHIVPIHDFAEHRGIPYLVMKFVDGPTLKGRLADGPLAKQLGLSVFRAVAQALAYAHRRGILHRDIKPSNVLLAKDGAIYLTDFGLARIAAEGESTLSSELMIGTPQYISPEQARCLPELDGRTDIYSLGIILYELIVGHVPFDADTPISVIHDHLYSPLVPPSHQVEHVPPAMESVLLRALEKEREARYATVDELLEAFDRADQPGPLGRMPDEVLAEAPTISPATRPSRGRGRRAGPSGLSDRPRPALVASNGARYPLAGSRLLIGREDPSLGRSPDIDLTSAEPLNPRTQEPRRTVHREQAWITRTPKGWSIEIPSGREDRAWLNGSPLAAGRSYPLAEGDQLRLGEVVLECEF